MSELNTVNTGPVAEPGTTTANREAPAPAKKAAKKKAAAKKAAKAAKKTAAKKTAAAAKKTAAKAVKKAAKKTAKAETTKKPPASASSPATTSDSPEPSTGPANGPTKAGMGAQVREVWVPAAALVLDSAVNPRMQKTLTTLADTNPDDLKTQTEELAAFGRRIIADSRAHFGTPSNFVRCLQLPLAAPQKNGTYLVLDGRRRVEAIELASRNKEYSVLVTVLDNMDQFNAAKIAWSGFDRRDLSPVQIALYGHRVVREQLRKQTGEDPEEKDIARWLNISPSTWANTLLPLARAKSAVQSLVQNRYLSIATYRANRIVLATYPEIAELVKAKLDSNKGKDGKDGKGGNPSNPGNPGKGKGKSTPNKRRTQDTQKEQAAINAAAKEVLGDSYKPTKEAQALSNPANTANTADGTAFDQFLGTLSDVGEIMLDSPVTIPNYGAFIEGLADLLRAESIDWAAVENYMVAATPPASPVV